MQRMEWGTYYNKVFVANAGGRGPDVFVIHADHIARFQVAGFLRPTDDLATPGGGDGLIDANDFDPVVWQACQIAGRHWTIPLDIHLEGMFFNRKLFRDAGIVDANGNPRPPTNRHEFLAAASKMTIDVDADGRPEQWGYVFDWLRNDVYTLMAQNGGSLFDPTLTRTTINSPENVEALQFAADLIAKEKIAPSPQNFGGLVGFRQGKVGMVFGGIFLLHDMQKQTDLDFGTAPLPILMKRPAAWGSSHNLCVRPDLTGDELAAARQFVKFLSDNSLDWSAAGQIPVRQTLRNSDRFQHRGNYAPKPDVYAAQRAFAQQIPHTAYYPSVMFVNEYVSEFDAAVERAVRLSMTPKQSLDLAAQRIAMVMRRYGVNDFASAKPQAEGRP
jgi:multiple sugar transport system substrate-binding protein